MNRAYTDEQLVRYLDGQLSAEKSADIQSRLGNDIPLVTQLEALSVRTLGIREAFDSALPLAPTVDVLSLQTDAQNKQVQPAAKNKHWLARLLPLAGSTIVALGVGLLVGLNADRFDTERAQDGLAPWQQAVVDYQLLYVPATLPAASPDEAAKRMQLQAISKASGLSVTSEMVTLPGLAFRRAQTLGLNGSPLIQIAFLGAEGHPIALCFTRVKEPAAGAVAKKVDGMNTVSWGNGEYGFIFVSFASAEQLSIAAAKAIELFQKS